MQDKLGFRLVLVFMVTVVFAAWGCQKFLYSSRVEEDIVRSEESPYAETNAVQHKLSDGDDEALAADGSAQKEAEDIFFLYNVNGFVVVYKGDRKTPYEYTSIECDLLPEKIQNEIKNGKYIKNIGELYSFLENYSS